MSKTIFRTIKGQIVPMIVDEEIIANYNVQPYMITPKHQSKKIKLNIESAFLCPNAKCRKCEKDVFFMKKTSAICPVCSKRFNPNKSYEHINEFHPTVSDYQLAIIRDARRQCYGQSKPVKHKNAALLPHTSIFSISRTRAAKLRVA